ncbi:acetolactate synthase [Halobacillus andaensis]|uniref:Acetolactate synthase n=1 Tax=Halobacillus andaensis TaxID=1176239 RepID=A0A917BE68_HALAA|nr:thiamine pyrophosphate-binding protein [Halobacillus andaensis]MBP2006339.1 acetolactate synthase-1/2/3 large subunit [Halobacillus andaensis]GGF34365.1 acetolactate synthase [Halobacillus andaensis]
MKSVKAVVDYLKSGNVSYIFGIPAGSVNAFFDELYETPEITPIVTKHEGAASYMAAAYAKYSNEISVCIGSSGPGGTNLVTGAANAMREHLPILFLTGSVPVHTVGLNASQELDAHPIYESVTKYSKRVDHAEDLLDEIHKAVEIAVSGVPGPVHIAMPIDVQLQQVEKRALPPFPKRTPLLPEDAVIEKAIKRITSSSKGFIFAGQGVRGAVPHLLELAELLKWPIITSPQAKGLIPDDHPLRKGIFGFAGHESASELINEGDYDTILVVGSSLGETATNNYNPNISQNKTMIQIDYDEEVFNRKYPVDTAILGDTEVALSYLNQSLHLLGYERTLSSPKSRRFENLTDEYSTKNVILRLQDLLPTDTRYTIDIGEFMAYVIHHMNVLENDSFDINVHFGAMGSGIGSAIGSKLAEPNRPTVSITGDGCFFMHGMELLTAKEYQIPVLFVVMNNARLGMVHHGHSLQYQRAHDRFSQEPVDISSLAKTLGIPSVRVNDMEDLNQESIHPLLQHNGPTILEIALVDDRVPPMGDRVKFLSSFGK